MLDMARTALLHGLEDPNTYARTHAVRAIGTIGTAADVPRLRGVAERDPASYGEPPVFPVRREAERAIARIRQREAEHNAPQK
jgi:HEAT repeat protein